MDEKLEALDRLHDEYRLQEEEEKESEDDEWIRIQTTGGGAET